MSGHRTDFAAQTVEQMRAALFASDPSSVRAAASRWQATGDLLTDMQQGLTNALQGFSGAWSGGAADAYQKMMSDLAAGIGKVAADAYTMENLTHDAADALDTARSEMPGPVTVPQLPPTVVALASTPLQVSPGATPAEIMQAQQQQQAAVNAVNAQQQAVAASDAAHTRAVAVMTQLANSYTTVTASIPARQVAAQEVPQVSGTGAAPSTTPGSVRDNGSVNLTAYQTPMSPAPNGTATKPAAGSPLTAHSQPQNSPLFGDMFSAGLAAATAAGMGRFSGLIPKLPSWVTGKKDKSGQSTSDPQPQGQPPALPEELPKAIGGAGAIGAGAKLGGVGGIGGVVGAGGGGGAAPPTPTANADLFGGQPGVSPSVISGAAAGAAGGAGQSSGMMPMMPMGGMAGAGSGTDGGRRIPPWLTETEDVWGESSTISPPVIGQ